jgi:putative solute:sodium symporter small subunit
MQLTQKHRDYWRKNLVITTVLLLIWAVVTFVPIVFARAFNEFSFFGWPLGFYMGAQGALIVYVAIVWLYARLMGRLDRDYGLHEPD